MAELIKKAWKGMSCASPDLWPKTDYRKHVPSSAKELAEKNWTTTGNTLRNAMNKAGERNGSGKNK